MLSVFTIPFSVSPCLCGEFSVNESLRDLRVRIDASVAEERPVTPDLFHQAGVDFANQNFFFIVRSLGDDASERIADKRASPEVEARAGNLVAANIAGFVSNAIHGTDVNSI